MRHLILFLLAALWVLPGTAQSYLLRAERFSSDSLGSGSNISLDVKWVGKGARYGYYDLEEQGGRNYYLIDLKSGHRNRLFDNERLVALITPYADSLNVRRPTVDRLGLSRLDFDEVGKLRFEFNLHKLRLQYDIRTEKLRVVPKKPAEPSYTFGDEDYTTDSLYAISAERHNLLLVGREGDTLRLTRDGEPYYSFASGSEAENEGTGSLSGCWIGKSHKYLALREDKRRVGVMTLVNSLATRPVAKTYKYILAGDQEVTRYEFWLVDADRGEAVKLDTDRYADQTIEIGLHETITTTDRAAYFLRRSRTRDSMELCRVDAIDGTVRPIICETTPNHLNEQLFTYHLINNGNEILWWSERSGRGQFYLYDADGKLKRPITDGRFVAGHIARIDTARRSIVVEGYGGEAGINPHYRLFYKAPLDGGKVVCLTPADGHHNINISPDGNYLYDKWSRMNQPEMRRIADLRGHTVCELPSWDVASVRAKGWREPELLELTAADSMTKLYGVVYLPFEIEPGRNYPIISQVYPGPQDDQVPLAFSVSNANQTLAQLGFIVVNFSHRGGAPTRGREYYNYGYGNLRDYALDDDMAIIRQVAARYPFADLNRVGIYGHSGGGFMTAAALLQHPDFYKVGVAASGNHDNNIYGQDWGEVFHGVTQSSDKEGRVRFECRIPTTVELAPNLRGRLMLIHGEMDNNVHPASTMRLANALIRARKRFDMMIIPGADHGLPVSYFENLVRYYFVENLLGLPQSDTDIIRHE